MAWTKQQLVEQAYREIGLASGPFDLPQEEMQDAARTLDAMMANWNRRGLRLGYAVSGTPESIDINQASGIEDGAVQAVVVNLAVRLAPGFGKQVSRETKKDAKESYVALLAQSTKPKEMQIQQLPSGQGNKYWRYNSQDPFLERPVDPLESGPDAELDFEGGD